MDRTLRTPVLAALLRSDDGALRARVADAVTPPPEETPARRRSRSRWPQVDRDGRKPCLACAVPKPLAAFAPRRANRDGHIHRCLECERAARHTPGADPAWREKRRATQRR